MADKKISQLTGATTPLAGTEVLPVVQSGATVKVAVSDLTAGRTVSASSVVTTGSVGAGGAIAGASSTPVVQVKNASFNSLNGQDLRFYQNIYFDGANYRYITANPGGFMVQYQNNWDWYVSTDVSPSAGGTATTSNILTLNDNGNLTFKTGNLVQGTAAKGVNFTANTPAAGMTSQLLNWYEEGTWTPTMTSAAGTTTVNASSARYTRVGDHVFVVFQINYSTDASVGTSDFTIGGLPFTSRGTFNYRGFVTSSNWTGSDYNDGYITIGATATTLVWAGRAVNQNSRTNAILLFSADYFV